MNSAIHEAFRLWAAGQARCKPHPVQYWLQWLQSVDAGCSIMQSHPELKIESAQNNAKSTSESSSCFLILLLPWSIIFSCTALAESPDLTPLLWLGVFASPCLCKPLPADGICGDMWRNALVVSTWQYFDQNQIKGIRTTKRMDDALSSPVCTARTSEVHKVR